jgi:hypothetical protein
VAAERLLQQRRKGRVGVDVDALRNARRIVSEPG